MKIPPPAPAAVKALEQLTPGDENVAVRKVFGQPAAFVNGNMFLGVFGAEVFIRLSDADRKQASKIPGLKAFEPMAGRPMREYVVLTPSVLADRSASRRWVAKSLKYSATLPAKKTNGKAA